MPTSISTTVENGIYRFGSAFHLNKYRKKKSYGIRGGITEELRILRRHWDTPLGFVVENKEFIYQIVIYWCFPEIWTKCLFTNPLKDIPHAFNRLYMGSNTFVLHSYLHVKWCSEIKSVHDCIFYYLPFWHWIHAWKSSLVVVDDWILLIFRARMSVSVYSRCESNDFHWCQDDFIMIMWLRLPTSGRNTT